MRASILQTRESIFEMKRGRGVVMFAGCAVSPPGSALGQLQRHCGVDRPFSPQTAPKSVTFAGTNCTCAFVDSM